MLRIGARDSPKHRGVERHGICADLGEHDLESALSARRNEHAGGTELLDCGRLDGSTHELLGEARDIGFEATTRERRA